MGLELTRRDLALLWYTWQNRLMTPRQYLRRFWSDATHQAASKRLTHLKNEGLLQYVHFPWGADRSIYTITAAGNRALIEARLLPPDQTHDFPQRPLEMTAALVQALSVVDMRIAFELSGAKGSTWIAPHQLRQGRHLYLGNPRVADGIFSFNAHGRQGRGILEFERQSYPRRKFIDILHSLRYAYENDTIFYVARSTERARRVWNWAKDAWVWGDRPKNFLVTPLNLAAKDGLDALFFDLKGRGLESA
ncbi:MAG TPA: hypothetical protein VK914_04350 [bacterium]|jgi:hypothetical protein|nr:hypothetical protein [bacterium]